MTDNFTSADLDVLIPEKWGERLNDFFRSQLRFGSFFIDRSEELADGGDTLNTPNITEMSANTKSTNSEVTLRELGVTQLTYESIVHYMQHIIRPNAIAGIGA